MESRSRPPPRGGATGGGRSWRQRSAASGWGRLSPCRAFVRRGALQIDVDLIRAATSRAGSSFTPAWAAARVKASVQHGAPRPCWTNRRRPLAKSTWPRCAGPENCRAEVRRDGAWAAAGPRRGCRAPRAADGTDSAGVPNLVLNPATSTSLRRATRLVDRARSLKLLPAGGPQVGAAPAAEGRHRSPSSRPCVRVGDHDQALRLTRRVQAGRTNIAPSPRAACTISPASSLDRHGSDRLGNAGSLVYQIEAARLAGHRTGRAWARRQPASASSARSRGAAPARCRAQRRPQRSPRPPSALSPGMFSEPAAEPFMPIRSSRRGRLAITLASPSTNAANLRSGAQCLRGRPAKTRETCHQVRVRRSVLAQ